jgi:hypothetical protein
VGPVLTIKCRQGIPTILKNLHLTPLVFLRKQLYASYHFE